MNTRAIFSPIWRIVKPHEPKGRVQAKHDFELFRNFKNCPHCMLEVRCSLPTMSLGYGAQVVTRSDGANFHLVFGGGPILYPAGQSSQTNEMVSLGFWYAYRSRAAAVVVLLRRPPFENARLFHCVERIADALAEELARVGELPSFVEADASTFLCTTYER